MAHTDTALPADAYARITSRILADLEQGARPWLRPWSSDHLAGRITRPLRSTGEPYTGINVLLLWLEGSVRGYASPSWMTYKQAQAMGAQVRRGEQGAQIVYFGSTTRPGETAENKPDGEDSREVRFLKTYTVFNVAQVDGLPARYQVEPEAPDGAPPPLPFTPIAAAEAFLEATGAAVHHGGDRAYYDEGADRIQLPPCAAFRDAESYYATRAHETVHWTKHPARLDRDMGRQRWGDAGYAREELVAELGAAFLAADLGLAPDPRPDHAAYLAGWIKVLQEDKRAIVSAAAHAERAVRYLHGLQPGGG